MTGLEHLRTVESVQSAPSNSSQPPNANARPRSHALKWKKAKGKLKVLALSKSMGASTSEQPDRRNCVIVAELDIIMETLLSEWRHYIKHQLDLLKVRVLPGITCNNIHCLGAVYRVFSRSAMKKTTGRSNMANYYPSSVTICKPQQI